MVYRHRGLPEGPNHLRPLGRGRKNQTHSTWIAALELGRLEHDFGFAIRPGGRTEDLETHTPRDQGHHAKRDIDHVSTGSIGSATHGHTQTFSVRTVAFCQNTAVTRGSSIAQGPPGHQPGPARCCRDVPPSTAPDGRCPVLRHCVSQLRFYWSARGLPRTPVHPVSPRRCTCRARGSRNELSICSNWAA
jgi:hypothetical protein